MRLKHLRGGEGNAGLDHCKYELYFNQKIINIKNLTRRKNEKGEKETGHDWVGICGFSVKCHPKAAVL